MTLHLHYWPTPNGKKVTIFLEEAGLPYEIIPCDIGRGDQFAPNFLKLNPNNRMPVLVDDEPLGGGAPISVFESGAILFYLAEKTGKFWPQQGPRKWEVVEWLMWQMGGVGPMLGQVHHFVRYNQGKAPYAEERYLKEANRLYGVLDRRLADNEYVAGEYSIADIAIFPWIARFEWQTIDLNAYANVKRWYLAIAGREAVQRGYDLPSTGAAVPMP
jgi:GST-like protein